MDYWMLSAAVLSFILLIAHFVGGGHEVHVPMLESDMSRVNKAYASIIWHGITAILIVGSAGFLWSAMGKAEGHGVAVIVAAQYGAFTCLFLFYGVLRLRSVWVMPQWTAFLAISILAGISLGAKL